MLGLFVGSNDYPLGSNSEIFPLNRLERKTNIGIPFKDTSIVGRVIEAHHGQLANANLDINSFMTVLPSWLC